MHGEMGLRLQLSLSLILYIANVVCAQNFTDQTIFTGINFLHTGGGIEKANILEAHGSGAAFFDADSDGDLDLYLVNGSTFARYGKGEPNTYYQNQNGMFLNATTKSGLGDRGWGAGVAIADVNSDGNLDVYVSNFGSNLMYMNMGEGVFNGQESGSEGYGFSASAAFFDYDLDGDLDLFVTNYVHPEINLTSGKSPPWDPCIYLGGLRVFCGPVGLPEGQDRFYENDGTGTFNDVTIESGVNEANSSYGLGAVPADFDSDGDIDLFVANDERANVLWKNNGDGTLSNVALASGTAFNADGEEESGMGTDVGDFDGDGDEDIFVTNFYSETNTLYRNDGDLEFVDATTVSGLASPSVEFLGWGTTFFDYDLDGDLDLFVANGHVYPQVDAATAGGGYAQRNQLFRNDGGKYVEVRGGSGLKVEKVSRGTTSGDYDDDGDIDILVTNLDSSPTLLRNDSRLRGSSLAIELVGIAPNYFGVGSVVNVWVSGVKQTRTVNTSTGYLGANSLILHFGIPTSGIVEMIEVFWLDGSRSEISNTEFNQFKTRIVHPALN
ncbi:MAG: CRTAC1 family protein [Candidatus Latescibacterota bacterium]|nr:CRTAC1 family protein [Candidatus Latescibacterota bacterium]